MPEKINISEIKAYFSNRFKEFGASPKGLDWNSIEAQKIRFEQLQKVIDFSQPFSLIDYGCGYGAFFDHLSHQGYTPDYQGYDIVSDMLEKGRQLHKDASHCNFFDQESDLLPADYVIESGVFNVKLTVPSEIWIQHVISTLERMNTLSKKGMAFNLLTKYSDPEFMRDDLFYADPCYFFDYSKKHFSKNIALLHDYQIYDFTIIVRKFG